MDPTTAKPKTTRAELLKKLMKAEGYRNATVYLEWCVGQGSMCGICRGCEKVNESMEPDQREGYCEFCGENKVQAPLVLAGYM